MAFIGKQYKLEKQENFEAFIESMSQEIPEDYKKVLFTHKPTLKVVKNGDTYTLSSSKPDNSWTETSFKSGVEFEETVTDRKAKTVYTVNGNTITQVQKFPEATLTYKREFTDSELVATLSNSRWDGVARRFYKAV